MARLSQLLGWGLTPEPTPSTVVTLATYQPDAAVSGKHIINVGTTTGIAVAAALNPGPDLYFDIVNASGAASMTPPAFDAQYLMASNNVFPPPAAVGKQRGIGFFWNGAKYVEQFRSLSDI